MSLIDLASMVLAPTAVKDGKVYNAIPNDQDFTFSRGTEATRVNSAGLIEKARTNYLLQSNTFDTTWGTSNASVTSGQTGYDGSNNAWLLQASGTFAYVGQTGLSVNGVATASVYLKAGTANWVNFRIQASANNQIYVNVSNGTFGEVYASDLINKSIEDVGNGWYRVSVVLNVSSLSGFYIYVADDDNSLNTTNETVFIQSAQLEQGLVATDYIPTTTSSVTVGITDDLPRVDYSGGGCPSLLLEGSRTNGLHYSEYFDEYYDADPQFDNITITHNATISPEGLQNATKIAGNKTTNDPTTAYLGRNGAVSSQPYVSSVFAKAGEYDYLVMTVGSYVSGFWASFNLDTGEVDTQPTAANTTASIEDYGNGWYRCMIHTTNSGGAEGVYFSPSVDGTISTNYLNTTDGIYIYGAQCEEGNYISSYIPTYSTSTSRSADSCSLTNASNLIGQSEGTLFAEFDISENVNTESYILRIDETSYNNTILIFRRTDKKLQAVLRSSATTIISIITTETISDINKVALAYTSGDFAFYINGVLIGTSTSTYSNVITYDDVRIGGFNSTTANMNGKISQAILFPTRLTNDQLQELTK